MTQVPDQKTQGTPLPSVPDRLRAMADLFAQRDREYGNNYLDIGPTLHAMFPEGLLITSADGWQRVFTITMAAMKITRYAKNIDRGGHQDSLDDLSVYMQMGAHTDRLARARSDARRDAMLRIPEPPHPPVAIMTYEEALVRAMRTGDEMAIQAVASHLREMSRPIDPPLANDEWRRETTDGRQVGGGRVSS